MVPVANIASLSGIKRRPKEKKEDSSLGKGKSTNREEKRREKEEKCK